MSNYPSVNFLPFSAYENIPPPLPIHMQHPHHLGAILIFKELPTISWSVLNWCQRFRLMTKFRAFHGHLHFRCRYLRWVVWLLSWTRLCNICSSAQRSEEVLWTIPDYYSPHWKAVCCEHPSVPPLLGKSESIQNQQNLSLSRWVPWDQDRHILSPLPGLSASGMAAPACNTVLVSNSAQNNLQLAILPPSGHSVHVLESLTRLPVSHVSREEHWFFF